MENPGSEPLFAVHAGVGQCVTSDNASQHAQAFEANALLFIRQVSLGTHGLVSLRKPAPGPG